MLRAALILLTCLLCVSARAEILIGVAGPMSGQNAVFGQQMKAGAEAAVAAINASGGINGELLELVIEDDGCDARAALTVAQNFANRDVRLVAGHFCTGASLAAGAIYEDRKIVMISPSATLPRLTEEGRVYTFRIVSRDDAQADQAVARMRKDDPAAKLALVTDNTPATKTIADRFQALTPVTIFAYKPGALDFVAVARDLKAQGFTSVYFACNGGDAGRIAQALRRLGHRVELYGSDAVLSDEFWEKAGPTGEGMLVTFPVDLSAVPGAEQLQAKLKPESLAYATYAAIETYVAAAKAKSVNDPRAVVDYLRSGTDIPTVIGKIGFDAKGDVRPQRFTWYRWSQGSYAADPQ